MHNHINIIIIDDESNVLESVENGLQITKDDDMSYNIITFTDPLQAIQHINNNYVDVIITDYKFDGSISGDELLNEVTNSLINTFVIMMSGYDEKVISNIIRKNYNMNDMFSFYKKPLDKLAFIKISQEIRKYIKKRKLPYFLSVTLDTYLNLTDIARKFRSLENVIEMYVRHLFIIIYSDYKHKLQQNDNIQKFVPKYSKDIKITSGGWISLLSQIVKYYNDNSFNASNQLIAAIINEINDCMIIDKLYEFNNDRTKFAHKFVSSEAQYIKTLSHYEEIFVNKVLMYSILKKICFFHVVDINFVQESSLIKYSIELLNNDKSIFNVIDIQTENRMIKSRIYCKLANYYLDVNELLKYCTCEQCTNKIICIIDQITKNTLSYIPLCNHTINRNNTLFNI